MIGIHEFGGRQFPPAELLPSSAARGWNGVAAELRNHPPGEILALVPEQMEITLATARCDAARVQRRGNGDCRDTPLAAGTLRLCPIGVPEDSVRILGFLEGILHILISKEVFADISRSSSSAARAENVSYEANVRDEFLRVMAQRIGDELDDGSSAGAAPSNPACLGRHHFARAFRRAMGSPPNRFIGELRFRRAQELLFRTELSLADIADCCRFSSQSSFTRAFRRQVGVSPGEFRRKATSWEKARVKPSLPSHTGEAAAGTSRRLRGGSRPRYARHAPRLPSGRWPAPFPSHPAWS